MLVFRFFFVDQPLLPPARKLLSFVTASHRFLSFSSGSISLAGPRDGALLDVPPHRRSKTGGALRAGIGVRGPG